LPRLKPIHRAEAIPGEIAVGPIVPAAESVYGFRGSASFRTHGTRGRKSGKQFKTSRRWPGGQKLRAKAASGMVSSELTVPSVTWGNQRSMGEDVANKNYAGASRRALASRRRSSLPPPLIEKRECISTARRRWARLSETKRNIRRAVKPRDLKEYADQKRIPLNSRTGRENVGWSAQSSGERRRSPGSNVSSDRRRHRHGNP